MAKINLSAFPTYQFWGFTAVFIALFFMGGSSRADVQSLAILNPILVIFCGCALLTLKYEHWYDKRWFLGGLVMFLMLAATYLAPLSWPVGMRSEGISELAELRAAANVSETTQALAIAPAAGWQSFFFLFAPLAVFLFAIQLNRNDRRYRLILIISIGAISGIIGILQLAGSANSSFYLYRITNNSSAVGLFANRNHAAVFLACLFPMLAVFAAKAQNAEHEGRSTQRLIAIALAVILIPLILVTGSRSGLLGAVVGLLGGMLIYNLNISASSELEKGKSFLPGLVVSVLICLIFVSIYFSRAEAIERIFAEPRGAIGRTDFWTSSLTLFWQYFPFGFGPGSFVPAFQNNEPDSLLSITYLNRLHNDWLETGLTFGVPGILVMLSGVVYYVRRSFILWFREDGRRSAVLLGRMASVIIAILGIASMSDYPLRTPAMMGFAALVLVWFTEAGGARKVTADNSG